MVDRFVRYALAGCFLLTLGVTAHGKCRSFPNSPDSFESMKLLLHKKLEKRGDGVVIKFGGAGQILSIFKFDGDRDEVSDSVLQEELKGAAEAIKFATQRRGDKIMHAAALPSWTIGAVSFHAETVTATYKEYNVTAYEYIGLSHDSECMLKVRFTNAADTDDGASLDRYRNYVEKVHVMFGSIGGKTGVKSQ